MKVRYAHCAGLDVHKKSVSVCVRKGKGKKVETSTAVFGTFTSDLERMREFLRRCKVQRIVMESTGVYWIPVWNVLEHGAWKFDLVLVNPQHVRALPGRKTDKQDCERLAELGQYDMLRGSFIPPVETRELRDLTRRRAHLQGDRNRLINRINRLLETANLKLSSVVSDVVGKTGWLILNAIAKGNTEPEDLVKLAQGSLKGKREELAAALQGFIRPDFQWLLGEALQDLSHLDEQLNQTDARIRERMVAQADAIRRLCTIPGVQEITAWTLIAELGTDMTQFADAAHAASWAGLCPCNCESAGKRQSGRTRKGDRYLRRTLIQNAWGVAHKKGCFLTALFYRITARRGMKRAAMAVAHRILVIAYFILRDGGVYQERGGNYFDKLNPERTAKRLIERLEAIGYQGNFHKIVDPPMPPGDITAAEPKNKRGRPRRTTSPMFGTTKWSIEAITTTPSPPVASPEICRQCAGWGIPCIHARNAKYVANSNTDAPKSVT
jgi:transposase